MRKSWGLLEKILNGRKRIESRWYKNKYRPWGRIRAGETIYFKNSSEPVTARAEVKKVLQFEDLTPGRVWTILLKYGKADGLAEKQIPEFYQKFKDKRFCLLIFLKNPQKIKPFEINKAGFGAMSSWITIDSIKKITKGMFKKRAKGYIE